MGIIDFYTIFELITCEEYINLENYDRISRYDDNNYLKINEIIYLQIGSEFSM